MLVVLTLLFVLSGAAGPFSEAMLVGRYSERIREPLPGSGLVEAAVGGDGHWPLAHRSLVLATPTANG